MQRPNIQIIFIDNEGCLIPGKGEPFPLDELMVLRRAFELFPGRVTICTGRSVPYVEAMTQVLGLTNSKLPCVCEGGAVLYWPNTDTYRLVREDPVDRDGFLALMEPGTFREELGKVACLSLYPEPGHSVDELYERAKEYSGRESYEITRSAAAVDITHCGVDKASGIRAACDELGFSEKHALCIGDSENDLSMLRAAGIAASPLNATASVSSVSDHCSPLESTLGIVEILRRYAR